MGASRSSPFEVAGIAHPGVLVVDLLKLLSFYQGLLSLYQMQLTSIAAGKGIAYVVTGIDQL